MDEPTYDHVMVWQNDQTGEWQVSYWQTTSATGGATHKVSLRKIDGTADAMVAWHAFLFHVRRAWWDSSDPPD